MNIFEVYVIDRTLLHTYFTVATVAGLVIGALCGLAVGRKLWGPGPR